MKQYIFAAALFLSIQFTNAQQSAPVVYEYRMFTTVESVVAGGLGRSRLISTDKDSQMQEKDLEHIFSVIGIHFKNIQNNDQVITSKLNEYAKEGWVLDDVVNGVYAASEKSAGIFLTRYIFKRPLAQ